VAFAILKPFRERSRSAKQIVDDIQSKVSDQGRVCFRAEPTAYPRARKRRGLFGVRRGPRGCGLRRAAGGVGTLQGAVMKAPGMGFAFSSYQSNVPQLDVEVDRVKAKMQAWR